MSYTNEIWNIDKQIRDIVWYRFKGTVTPAIQNKFKRIAMEDLENTIFHQVWNNVHAHIYE
jgi:hypothetical protein